MRRIARKKTLAICSIALSTVMLTAASAGAAGGDGSKDGSGGGTEVVLDLETERGHRFEIPPPPPAAGTQVGGTHDVVRIVKGVEEAFGWQGFHCWFLEVVPGPGGQAVRQCNQTFYTPDGQITLQGITRAPLGPPQEFEEAVTGGTGKFRHARGYATYTLTNPGDPDPLYRIRIHLSKAAH
ncbi:dirigent protein [Streptomyces sp. NBC_01619]|uniref:hypothetical protein n=1 Tax=Streptomyces sp. NBC_01619 TaxID=2975901 RepID=UPI002259EE6E|nr:hypothetical protein [Streptomyces sp. NBC_01619]MCX4515712.1 dirigent protein [Streptomyces sp. NBC_01619]